MKRRKNKKKKNLRKRKKSNKLKKPKQNHKPLHKPEMNLKSNLSQSKTELNLLKTEISNETIKMFIELLKPNLLFFVDLSINISYNQN